MEDSLSPTSDFTGSETVTHKIQGQDYLALRLTDSLSFHTCNLFSLLDVGGVQIVILWRQVSCKWWENWQYQVERFPVLGSQFPLAWYYMHAHTHLAAWIWINHLPSSNYHNKCSTLAKLGLPELFNNQAHGFSWQNDFSGEAVCVNLLKH